MTKNGTLKQTRLPMPASSNKKIAAAILIIIGLLLFAVGTYGYAVGDLQAQMFDFPQVRSDVMTARKVAQSEGTTLSGTMGIMSFILNTSMILMIFGGMFIYLSFMLLTQPWERFKDFACVVPALTFFLIFVYYPMIDLMRISFTNWNLIKDDYSYVGLKNYQWLFKGSGLRYLKQSLGVTFTYTFWEITFTVVGGMLLALLFNRMTPLFTGMRSVIFMPKYIAVSTSAIVFIWILNGKYGILNYVISVFGGQGPNWLNTESTALAGILFLTFWRVTGYAMMIYLSAFRGIPQDYYEAAAIDGADGPQRFRFITLPMLAPTTLFLVVTTFIASMKVFQSVDVMTNGGPGRATNVMVQWTYNTAFADFRVDRAAAISQVFFIILLVITAATMRYSNRSVNYDS